MQALDRLLSSLALDNLLPFRHLKREVRKGGAVFGEHDQVEGEGPARVAPVLVAIASQHRLTRRDGLGGPHVYLVAVDSEHTVFFRLGVSFVYVGSVTGVYMACINADVAAARPRKLEGVVVGGDISWVCDLGGGVGVVGT
jgi:hypothetical protein